MKQNLLSRTNQRLLSFVVMVLLSLSAIQLSAQVSGTVWQDLPVNGTALNTYGVKDANELGVEGVTVTAYPGGLSAMTDVNGDYTIAGVPAGAVRIEFTWPTKNWLQSSPDADAQNTSVQFVTASATGVNFGLFDPADYANEAADIAMSFQVNNSGATNLFTVRRLNNADVPGVTVAGLPTDAVYDNNGVQNMDPINGDKIAFISETGSIWGVAYNSVTKDIYVSSSVRRYTALGPSGMGAIYKIDIANNVTLFATVVGTGVITPNASRNLSDNPTVPSHDPIFDEVGRIGLGDLDISADGTKLYTINVNTGELVIIDIANPATQTTHAISNPFTTCPGADVKSWAIGQHEGKVYVGSTCTTDLSEGIYVSEFDGTNFTAFHQVDLTGQGENSVDGGQRPAGDVRWIPWATNPTDIFDPALPIYSGIIKRLSFPAPLLSDIVFDENKGMILAIIDRTSMQAGHDNYAPDPADNFLYKYDASGDVMRVCKVGAGYVTEGGAGCPQSPARTVPLTNYVDYPEYFGGDEWNPFHGENALGGMAYQQGSNRILLSSFDPVERGYNGVVPNHSNSGIEWLSTVDGERTSGIRMAGGGFQPFPYGGKAGGIGDVEYLNAPAPIEIGNLVWEDTDGDGVQGAGESGIAGVVIKLFKSDGTTEIGTATTDANGNYIFSNDPNGASTASHIYQIAMLMPDQAYIVRIENATGGSQQAALMTPGLVSMSTPNIGEGSNADINDSDGIASGTNADAEVSAANIPLLGANNHTFDFGFSAAPPCPPSRCGEVGVIKN